ncbi:mannose-1-phosphate guanylyltransferase [Bacteroidia bacterium]|nr:mannose-1-phosphate guanylyltransferase [Bacteroidia bacterium]
MNNNYCLIMAGGAGVRFWPVSKKHKPKQFIDILGCGQTFLQMTFSRFEKICPKENIFIATNEIYKNLVKEQIPGISDNNILCEPAKRNTAPCIAYANYKIKSLNPNATIVVAPSDHLILKEDKFLDVVKTSMEAATNNEWLITIGIQPNNPNTGYGYIQFDENYVYAHDNNLKKVVTFTEKPPLELAKKFLQSGDFLWNAGIFIWNINAAMNAIKKYQPEMDTIFAAGVGKYNTPDEQTFINNVYTECNNISIDYGVMEKADNVYVRSSEFGWSDLGTWGSLYDTLQKDNNDNAVIGNNVLTYDTKNCVINMPKNKLTVVQGLDDFIIAEDNNILLICKKEDEQQIRQFVSDVEISKGEQFV